MKKFTALFLCSILFNINLFSDEKEVASYTAQKHKVDFYKQEAKVKEALTKEYDTVVKLSQNLEKDIMKTISFNKDSLLFPFAASLPDSS